MSEGKEADNAQQQSQIPILDQAPRSKLAELQQTLQLYDHHRYAETQRTVLSDRGRQQMEAIRHGIEQMRSIENRLLQQRMQAVSASARRTQRALPLLSGLIFAFLLVTLHLTQRYIADRRRVHR